MAQGTRASSAKTRGFHTQLDEGPDHPMPLALVASTWLNPVGKVLAWAMLGSDPSQASSQPSCLAPGWPHTHIGLSFQFLPGHLSTFGLLCMKMSWPPKCRDTGTSLIWGFSGI